MAIILSCLTTILGIVQILKRIRSELTKPETIVIGLVGKKIPACLEKFPDSTSLHKILKTRSPIVILHCRNLSYALRHCDWVCANASDDIKIFNEFDPFWVQLSKEYSSKEARVNIPQGDGGF